MDTSERKQGLRAKSVPHASALLASPRQPLSQVLGGWEGQRDDYSDGITALKSSVA